MARTLLDDLGTPVTLPERPQRVVSLVPSLTEAVAATCREVLVGATDWCIRPADLDVTRVRGTKNPDRAAIAALHPDLVICNQEENRRLDVERMRSAGLPVWVTVVEDLDGALASMRRLFAEVLGVGVPSWLVRAQEIWAPAAEPHPETAAIVIWRDPWMVVGPRTFTASLLERLGWRNAYADAESRYPHTSVAEIAERAGLVVLPDEPYAFGPDNGPEAFAGTGVRTVCVDGRSVTWYGPSLVDARAYLEGVLGAG